MSIRPVDMNGVIQRTQDVGTLKQHQDMKPMVDQQNIQIEVQREEYRQSEQVTRKDDSQMEEHRFDAKEEGKGQYQRQGRSTGVSDTKRRSKGACGRGFGARALWICRINRKKKQKEDRVVIKGAIGGFDVKI